MSQKLSDFVFASVPMPIYNGAYSRFYRNLKTTAERRNAADPEMKVFIRGKRSFNNLPNDWDDRPPANKKVYTKRQEIRTRKGFRDSIRHDW